MGRFKKVIATMLVACMTIVAPVSLGTAKVSANETSKIEEGKKSAIFSIDAGRKYFSKEQLMTIIEKAYQNGYTDVQLILGNDGLRLLLDDMTVVASGKTHSSEDVKKAVVKGNELYYVSLDKHKKSTDDLEANHYLTESEMDEILEYAGELGVGIIPVINSPGHMDAILYAMEELGIKDPQYSFNGKKSERTIDLKNTEAIEFNKELLKKYTTYFAKKGSKMFNFGCDEYANDIEAAPYTSGWDRLVKTGLYPDFIDYVNGLSKIIKDAGMKPMCFNDGIYYNSDDTKGAFDKDIIVSYWTAGWWGFTVAPASYLHSKGHEIINLNDGWYWVLGNIDSGGYHYNDAVKRINEKDFNEVPGDRTGVETIGSMQAVWCDNPKMLHDMQRIMNLMDLYSKKHEKYLVRPTITIPERPEAEKPSKPIEPSIPSVPSKPQEKPEEEGDGVKVEVADRIEGKNRYETSLEISKRVFTSSEKVFLVSGEKFPDALSAASLTANGNGPILLVNDKNMDKILAEVDRLNAKEIVFVGGGSISKANQSKVEKFAKENSSKIEKFEGANRYATAVKVAEQTIAKFGNKGKVIIADGRNYPDAVSIAPYASKEGIPVLLVNGNKVSKEVEIFLTKNKIKEAVFVGGNAAVGKDVEKLFKKVERVAGKNRYETSKKVAERFFASSGSVLVASGEEFADSLSASYYAASKNAPVLITKASSLDNSTRKFLEDNKEKQYYVIGGEKAVSSNLFK